VVWSGDIACIPTDERGLYLAAVIDLFSRQVVGWSMQPHVQASLVTDALRMAWFGSLKVGRRYGRRFATQREVMDELIDWLTFYNQRLLHATLGWISPMKFEEKWHAGQAKKAA